MPSRPSEFIPEQAVLKRLWWSFHFKNHKNVFIYRCIKDMHFALSKKFSNQSKEINGSISKKN